MQDVQDVSETTSDAFVCKVQVLKDGEQPPLPLLTFTAPNALCTIGQLLDEVKKETDGQRGIVFNHPTRPGRLTPCIPTDRDCDVR